LWTTEADANQAWLQCCSSRLLGESLPRILSCIWEQTDAAYVGIPLLIAVDESSSSPMRILRSRSTRGLCSSRVPETMTSLELTSLSLKSRGRYANAPQLHLLRPTYPHETFLVLLRSLSVHRNLVSFRGVVDFGRVSRIWSQQGPRPGSLDEAPTPHRRTILHRNWRPARNEN
jgi:hypothetical protein